MSPTDDELREGMKLVDAILSGSHAMSIRVEEILALGERAQAVRDSGIQHGVHEVLLTLLSNVYIQSTALGMMLMRDAKMELPGGVDILPKMFTPEELEDWVKRAREWAGQTRPIGGGGGVHRQLVALVDTLDALQACAWCMVQEAKQNPIAAPPTPRIVRPGEDDGPRLVT